jgi:hypothetical protein
VGKIDTQHKPAPRSIELQIPIESQISIDLAMLAHLRLTGAIEATHPRIKLPLPGGDFLGKLASNLVRNKSTISISSRSLSSLIWPSLCSPSIVSYLLRAKIVSLDRKISTSGRVPSGKATIQVESVNINRKISSSGCSRR